ncbi:hypothetical protein ANCCAN_14181 [Ancylostoma caninum]|uniref:Uncharacterized protein n=1 Tax=Ancylostoma caninum TaxID=29170 RepID=A0A368G657_ANCCA|nr:hypothetical protein ANCCAN_14181 [Ancylostoma caninum]
MKKERMSVTLALQVVNFLFLCLVVLPTEPHPVARVVTLFLILVIRLRMVMEVIPLFNLTSVESLMNRMVLRRMKDSISLVSELSRETDHSCTLRDQIDGLIS